MVQYNWHICNDSLLIGVCYRTNNTDIFSSGTDCLLRDLLLEVSKHRILLMGDFNYGNISWTGSACLAAPGASQETQLFCRCVQDTFLIQHVSEFNREKAILDLVFSSEPDSVSHVQTLNTLGDSDHSMLTFNLHMKSICKNASRSIFDYNKADFDSIRQELRKIDWTLKFQGDTLDCWSILKSILLELETTYVPTRLMNSSVKYRKPMWMTRRVA